MFNFHKHEQNYRCITNSHLYSLFIVNEDGENDSGYIDEIFKHHNVNNKDADVKR